MVRSVVKALELHGQYPPCIKASFTEMHFCSMLSGEAFTAHSAVGLMSPTLFGEGFQLLLSFCFTVELTLSRGNKWNGTCVVVKLYSNKLWEKCKTPFLWDASRDVDIAAGSFAVVNYVFLSNNRNVLLMKNAS